jgi:hypothetical protein
MITVEEAKQRRVCRICEQPISGAGCPVGWTEEFGRMVFPIRITLNFGQEFAHTDCLEKGVDNGGS